MWSIPATHPTTLSHSGCVTIVTKPRRSHWHRQNLSPSMTFFGDLISSRRTHYTSEETSTSNSAPRVGMSVFFHRRLSPHAGAWEHVANFLVTPFSHQERLASKSFLSSLVPLFETYICTFSSVLCPTTVFLWVFLIFPTPNDIYRILGVDLPPLAIMFYPLDLL